MNHLEVWEMENFESKQRRLWGKFCAEAERSLGHNLDGDALCGFSLDEAYDQFLAGMTGKAYAAMVKARPNYHPES